ncbi:MAG: cytochrome c nitrite reductase small subunit [Verrucomicrobia bacterium]|nr:cytochrome c nitrite reductase small subunit [Verrucomicrobiota bacterium]MDA1087719.1 cytochrome c nitrite reductase small subunit [Verrucomicrobiota bacterium]
MNGKGGVFGLSGMHMCLGALVGALIGIGGYTFRYAEGLSYFSTDPKACVNCHIMQAQYDSWQKASHHAVAGCVDCHLPHDFARKYLAKASNGYRHSKAFTFQDFHEPIMITPGNRRLLEENCRSCHNGVVHTLLNPDATGVEGMSCVRCHEAVGHGERTGLGGPESF